MSSLAEGSLAACAGVWGLGLRPRGLRPPRWPRTGLAMAVCMVATVLLTVRSFSTAEESLRVDVA